MSDAQAAKPGFFRPRNIILIGVFALIAFLLWQCVGLISAMNSGYKTEARFADAMKVVTTDARVIAALGEPIAEQGLYGYHVFSGTDGSQTTYGINLSGPKGTGKADVTVAEVNGTRTVASAVFADEKGRLTNLLVKD